MLALLLAGGGIYMLLGDLGEALILFVRPPFRKSYLCPW